MKNQLSDAEAQARLVQALRAPECYSHPVDRVEHIETHISHVLLAGEYAYKLKKPLQLGFLDFSTLERRRFCCHEEVRLNRRLAERIYLGVDPIVGPAETPRVGGVGGVLEYAVRMKRFPQSALLSRHPPSARQVERIAEVVARFHQGIPVAGPDSELGTPGAVLEPMLENFAQIRRALGCEGLPPGLEELEQWTRSRSRDLEEIVAGRRRDGHIRECHGDMHLGNIAWLDGDVVIFDGIEFNPALRWIDTLSDVAFLLMDLEDRKHPRLARRLLQGYLDITGDFSGLALLTFYKVYRAMVRAKVTAIRLGQESRGSKEWDESSRELAGYLRLARSYTEAPAPALIITHGLSGSGKSLAARMLAERLPAIRLRSDIERKRIFGMDALQRSGSSLSGGIYTAEATAATYDRLLGLAEAAMGAGEPVVVDATFLRQSSRRKFLGLARRLGVPFLILSVYAPPDVLAERVRRRYEKGGDASEANVAVLGAQQSDLESLTEDERRQAIEVSTAGRPSAAKLLARCRMALAKQ